MEQRIYRGDITADGLADFLVQRYDPQPDIQAQKLGEGSALIVQIGRGDKPEEIRHAASVAIAATSEGGPGVAVTVGQQQWLNPRMAGYTAMMGLVAWLITPWVLFALIWPLSDLIGGSSLPSEIQEAIDLYAASRGAVLAEARELTHPHAG